LSHQDIGSWPFINHPWGFALPYDEADSRFTKDFIGREALERAKDYDNTYPFAGYDVRKVSGRGQKPMVLDADGSECGVVLSCVSHMGIDRYDNKILSISSPDRPTGFIPRGLSCGFVKVKKTFMSGDQVILTDGRRTIKAEIVDEIRPDRTARCTMQTMLGKDETAGINEKGGCRNETA